MNTDSQPFFSTPTGSQATSPAEAPTLQSLLSELSTRPGVHNPLGKLGAHLETATGALWSNRLRSFLTVLGIFIGVASVVALLTFTQGAAAFFTQIIGNSANNIYISPIFSGGGATLANGFRRTLTRKDFQSIDNLSHVAYATPMLITGAQVIYGTQNWNTGIQGVNMESLMINNIKMAQGSWFSNEQASGKLPVAVLGNRVSRHLFGASGDDPIGKKISIRDQIFQVVGVIQSQGLDSDDVIFVPLQAMQIRLRNVLNYDSIQVQVDSASNVESTMDAITAILRQNHHLIGSQVNDFQLFNFAQSLQREEGFLRLQASLFVGIAAISLTVGGIGIMNIMLVSVTERTREIGIRMAAGARRSDIRTQFITEAIVLCLLGGVIGMGLGLMVGWWLTTLSHFPYVITPTTLIVPLAVSVGIALVFGIYPAIRASHLDPIVAIASS